MGTMVDMSPVSKRFVAKGLSTDAAKASAERDRASHVRLVPHSPACAPFFLGEHINKAGILQAYNERMNFEGVSLSRTGGHGPKIMHANCPRALLLDLELQAKGFSKLVCKFTECYASMKEIGMYNLRRTLQAANMPDVEATAEYIFGARMQL